MKIWTYTKSEQCWWVFELLSATKQNSKHHHNEGKILFFCWLQTNKVSADILDYLSMSQLCLKMFGNFVYLRRENINRPCMKEFRLPVKISIKWSSFVSAKHKQVFISRRYFFISYQNILNILLKSPSLPIETFTLSFKNLLFLSKWIKRSFRVGKI